MPNQHKLILSHSPGGITFIQHLLGRPLIAKIPNVSIISFIGVYGSKFTKLSTLVEHHEDCLPWKFDGGGGVTAENFERIAKNLEFLHLCMRKCALCLPQGSKVKVEHTPCRPLSYGSTAVLSVQKFASVPELLSWELYAPIAIFQFLAPNKLSAIVW